MRSCASPAARRSKLTRMSDRLYGHEDLYSVWNQLSTSSKRMNDCV